METTLYSTGCPKCNVLKKKLDEKNINFNLSDDVEYVKEKGFRSIPILEIDGECMEFSEAIKWVNAQ